MQTLSSSAEAPADLRPWWLIAVAKLPMGLWYGFTAVLVFIVLRVLRYRVDTVRSQMASCFTERTPAQINQLVAAHYYQVGQVVAEAFKAADMTPEQFSARVAVRNAHIPRQLLAAGRPIILVAAHQANWEWILHALALHLGAPLDVGYKPIKAPWAQHMMYAIRTRFGAHLVPAKELLADMLKRRNIVRGIAMLGDQEPLHDSQKHWTTVLGRETAFYMGAEQMARATRYAGLFVAMRRLRRGYYEIDFAPLCGDGERQEPGEFTERYARLVEIEILAAPQDWTWGHRRWKLRKGLY